MSSNCNLRSRKPAVAELARLLATVSRFACWALMPLAAVYNARIISNSPYKRSIEYPLALKPVASDSGQVFGRSFVEAGIKDAQRFLHHLCLPLDQHHLHGAVNCVFIGSLYRTLNDNGLSWSRLYPIS